MKGILSHPRPTSSASRPPSGRERPGLEVQIHPADIRKSVRYLFLTRRQVAGLVAAVVLFVGFLVGSLALAPAAVASFLRSRDYGALEAERAKQGERLQVLNDHLEEFQERSKEVRLEMERIMLAYGLSGEESIGQGGYPETLPPAPDSIYKRDIERGQHLMAEVGDRLLVIDAFLDEVEEFETAYSEQVRATPSIMPLPADSFVLTSPYGERVSPFTEAREQHAGIDLAALAGTPIYAAGDGRVVFAGRYPPRQSAAWWRYGNLVVIRHDENFITLYGHCDEIKVRQHQQVSRGDLIATVGSTGWSTNPHLHYEVRRRDESGEFRPVDPRIYILDHRWEDHERLLIRARRSPPLADYEALPRLLTR